MRQALGSGCSALIRHVESNPLNVRSEVVPSQAPLIRCSYESGNNRASVIHASTCASEYHGQLAALNGATCSTQVVSSSAMTLRRYSTGRPMGVAVIQTQPSRAFTRYRFSWRMKLGGTSSSHTPSRSLPAWEIAACSQLRISHVVPLRSTMSWCVQPFSRLNRQLGASWSAGIKLARYCPTTAMLCW